MDPRQRLHMMGLLRSMAAAGRTILFSSHILEEVERLADSILVVYAGRLAAAGDFRSIRRLMTDRPHTFRIRSSDDRGLAAALWVTRPSSASNSPASASRSGRPTSGPSRGPCPTVAKAHAISLFEVGPTDDSLESVFSYLVRR